MLMRLRRVLCRRAQRARRTRPRRVARRWGRRPRVVYGRALEVRRRSVGRLMRGNRHVGHRWHGHGRRCVERRLRRLWRCLRLWRTGLGAAQQAQEAVALLVALGCLGAPIRLRHRLGRHTPRRVGRRRRRLQRRLWLLRGLLLLLLLRLPPGHA